MEARQEKEGWWLFDNPLTKEIEIFPTERERNQRMNYINVMAGIPEIGR